MVFPHNVGRAFKQRPTNVGIRTSMLPAKSAQMKKRTGGGSWGGWQIQNKKHEASLIGGFNPSERYKSQLGWLFPIYGKSKKSCSKPPTSCLFYPQWWDTSSSKFPLHSKFPVKPRGHKWCHQTCPTPAWPGEPWPFQDGKLSINHTGWCPPSTLW